MSHRIDRASRGLQPRREVCDVSAGSIRMAWTGSAEGGGEDAALAALRREEAIAEHLRRFLRTTERYLKGELAAPPHLGAWRRSGRGQSQRE